MNKFEFVSHEKFPDDPYVKELVYLCFDGKYRVAYVRKQSKNGGLFWGEVSISINKDGVKKYYNGFMQDSSFLEKDIKDFLDNRKWETNSSYKQISDDLPF